MTQSSTKIELEINEGKITLANEELSLDDTKNLLEFLHIGTAEIIHFYGVVASKPFSGVEGLFLTQNGALNAATEKLNYLINQKYPGSWKIDIDPDSKTYTATQWDDIITVRITTLKFGAPHNGK